MKYKVKEVADLVGISVRTLHHYDQIDLLKPDFLSDAGYRLYSDNNLEKLQQILYFKELNFNLQEIKNILDNPEFDRKHALKSQKSLLFKKKKRLEKIIASIDKSLEAIESGVKMSKNDMFESFNMTNIEEHQKKYAEETKQKYGHTDAFSESHKRTSNYSKEDWASIMEKADDIYKSLAQLMDKEPSDLDVQEKIHAWREYINDNYYTCTPEIFEGLGNLYVEDERFTANIDKYHQGLAIFMKKAIDYYCNNL